MEDTTQYFEDKQDDGSVLKHHRIRHLTPGHVSFDQTENVELLEVEGPPHEAMEFEDKEEILDDGTVHKMHKVHKHSLKHVRKSLKSDAGEEDVLEEKDVEVEGSGVDTVLETFEEPPQTVMDIEEEEEILDDGTRVKHKVISSSQVQRIRTRTKSIDEGGQEISSDEYEIEEIVPGTQACFVQRDSISSSGSSLIEELEQLEAAIKQEQELLDDGTEVQNLLMQAKRYHRTRSRSRSRERTEGVTVQERKVTPSHSPVQSPRSRSPAPAADDETPANLQSVSKIVRSEYIEMTTRTTEGSIERSSEFKTDDLSHEDALTGPGTKEQGKDCDSLY